MILDMHDVEQGKPPGRVEGSKQIDVAVRTVLAARRGTEEGKATHAKPAQLSLLGLQCLEHACLAAFIYFRPAAAALSEIYGLEFATSTDPWPAFRSRVVPSKYPS